MTPSRETTNGEIVMTIEERARQAAEQLLGDESLTGEMQDAEAQTLLDWAISFSRRLSEHTLEMDDARAEEYLSAALPNLRRVIRRTNKLVGSLPQADIEMMMSSLAGIFESAAQVPELTAAPPGDLATLASSLAQLSPADALAQILSLLDWEVTDGT
jgi:hypothetical protein